MLMQFESTGIRDFTYLQNQHSSYNMTNPSLCISALCQDSLKLIDLVAFQIVFEQGLESKCQLVRQHDSPNNGCIKGGSDDLPSSMLSESAYVTEIVSDNHKM